MHRIRQVTRNDIKDVFSFVEQLMLQYSEESIFVTSLHQMQIDYEAGRFDALLLTDSVGIPLGTVVYSKEHSELLGGTGLYLDIFFLSEKTRGQGLGRSLMQALYKLALESNLSFIKLVYKFSPALHHTYSRLGYTNRSLPNLSPYASGPPINIFEIVRPNMIEFISKRFPLPHPSINETSYPLERRQSDYQFEDENLIKKLNLFQSTVVCVEDLSQPGVKASFTKQIVYCAWIGRMIMITDLQGDVDQLITPELLQRHITEWVTQELLESQMLGILGTPLGGIWIEVPLESVHFMDVLECVAKADNITLQEGWSSGWVDMDTMAREVGFEPGIS